MNISSVSVLNSIDSLKNNDISVKNDYNRNKFQQLLEKTLKNNNSNDIDNNTNKYKKKIDKKLMDVCYQMESIFVNRMLKEMRNTIPEDKLIDGGFAEQVFEDMLYDEYSLTLSKTSNLGLAKMLYDELS